MRREVAIMSIPIADDFAAIATGMREDTPADREAPATAEQMAALKFAAVTSPAFTLGATRCEWLSDAAEAYADFCLMEKTLCHDDEGLEKLVEQNPEAFTNLMETLGDRGERLILLGKVAKIAELRLLCVLTRVAART
jgi:hypothetical protein